jgi:hypothetical protein
MYHTVLIPHSPLIQETFRFRLNDEMQLLLREYYYETRETIRHKFKPLKWYDAIDRRRSSIGIQEVEVPEDIINQVKQNIFNKITYLKP